MRHIILTFLTVALSFVCVAQTRTVNGVVFDDKGFPIAGAVIQPVGVDMRFEAKSDGTFVISIPYYIKELSAMASGYLAQIQEIDGSYLIFKLQVNTALIEANIKAAEEAKAEEERKLKEAQRDSLARIRAERAALLAAERDAAVQARAEEAARLAAERKADQEAAVDANAQIGVGLGYNLLTTTPIVEDEFEYESLNGFYLEATCDFNFLNKNWGSLGLQPGIRYTFAGESESDEIAGVKIKTSFTEHYLDIPVNVKYAYDIIPSTLKAYAFAGPVFSLGLASNLKAGAGDTSVKTNDYKDKEYGRFDIKFGIGAGVTVAEKLNVKLGYNIGMLNRYTGEQISKDLKYKTHTGVFYLGVGFNF